MEKLLHEELCVVTLLFWILNRQDVVDFTEDENDFEVSERISYGLHVAIRASSLCHVALLCCLSLV